MVHGLAACCAALAVGTTLPGAVHALAARGPAPGTFASCPAALRAVPARWQPSARVAARTFLSTT